MKFTKKILSVLLALIMMMSVVAVSASANSDFPSYSTTAPALKIGTVDYTGSGNVVVPVTLERNPGVWAVNLQIQISDNLTFVAPAGSLNDGCDITTTSCLYSITGNVLTMYIESTAGSNGLGNITANGSLIKLTFAPKAYTVGAIYPVDFTYVDRKAIINSNAEDLNFTFANGGVKCVSKASSTPSNPSVVKPSAPVVSSVAVTKKNQVTVKWGKANGATSYDVQRKIGSKAWTTVKAGATGVSYVDTKATTAGTYSYRVVAKNSAGTAVSAAKTVKVMNFKDKATIKSVKPGKKQVTVTIKKKVTNANGYQYQVGTNKKVTKGKKTLTTTKAKATIKKLSAKKVYYVKVRAYKTINGKKVYGAWSAVKKASGKTK